MAEHDLPFPSPDDMDVAPPLEAAITARFRASYAALPTAAPATVAAVARAAMRAPDGVIDTSDLFADVVPDQSPQVRPASVRPAAARRVPRPQWWWGAAAAAVLVVTVARPWRPGESQRQADSAFGNQPGITQPVGFTSEESDGAIRFDLTLPDAVREVSLVGDFNGWDENATPMVQRSADGTWSARVPLAPGRHTYAFVVDGQQWLVDPLAPQVPDAGFGPTNAVIVDGTLP